MSVDVNFSLGLSSPKLFFFHLKRFRSAPFVYNQSFPPMKRTNAAALDALANPENVPADIDIPDNYVSHTLKTQKPLPPLDWNNWYRELNWLNVAILSATPFISFVGAYFTKLRWETAVFSIFYYYVTGLGSCFPLLSIFFLFTTFA
jgi:hypothetical protein